jgi:hypothetical protein
MDKKLPQRNKTFSEEGRKLMPHILVEEEKK